MIRKLLFGGESDLSPQANAGLALLRIFAGTSLALAHGMGKLPPSEGLINTTAGLGFPLPVFFSWAAAMSELVGGTLMALGLFTRFAGFFVAFTMMTAILGVHAADPYPKKELAFVYFFIAIAFMIKGSADWSIDGFLRK
ncbi:MAG: DoxX family protein [Acidobacteriota bacterium]